MSGIDWLVLSITLFVIVAYGLWKSRGTTHIDQYLLADKKLPWYHVGLSVMATQASAITFLAGPGQAYSDGMRFLQFYFGLPLAMVVLCVTFIPIFRNLNVYTAYEYLETRFDIKTRALTSLLFLIQRGISTGLTIYAPSIVLSVILGVNIYLTTLFIGAIVILYTVYGGTRAVSHTQLLQMCIIFGGLIYAAYVVVNMLPANVSLTDALHIAGKMDKLKTINTEFKWDDKYNIWSGIIGGFFLQLSYFGTDQSQVGRYLTGRNVTQSRLGLVMNGLIKIPMQFFILLIGILVFSFYQFHESPVYFNKAEIEQIEKSEYAGKYKLLEEEHKKLNAEKQQLVTSYANALQNGDTLAENITAIQLKATEKNAHAVRDSVKKLMKKNNKLSDADDTNYVFLTFVTTHLPVGLIGLLIAIIFLASMGSTAGGLNSLASTTVIDVYRRLFKQNANHHTYLFASRLSTVGWGIFCILIALYAGQMGNLLEAVNKLGSLFYGPILGVFIVAFYVKYAGGTAVFYSALVAEAIVFVLWILNAVAFLWLNVVGCLVLVLCSVIIQAIINKRSTKAPQ